MRKRFTLCLLAFIIGVAWAQPQVVPDYSTLGIVPGTPGGTLRLSLRKR
jgi:hypothetical protein